MEIVKMNPGASQPLRIKVSEECNVSDEVIIANIMENSKNQTGWVKLKEPHDGIAIICGSGPSLKDSIGDIGKFLDSHHDADLFALNGAAKFLNDNNLLPDYQVIMDARPETRDLIGPAIEYLFASQVDPSLFAAIPNAQLWQATHGELALEFPDYHYDYFMVGGGSSVGNTVLPLVYGMGYREIHCYGYDSSNKGTLSHAFKQELNEGEPCTLVYYGDKVYESSLAMKLQADHFGWRAKQLQKGGCKIFVHGYGLLPDMWNNPIDEKSKYQKVWEHPEYRNTAPGELIYKTFLMVAHPRVGQSVIDFGAGTGRGALALAEHGLNVTMIDFAENCLDNDVSAEVIAGKLDFKVHDIDEPLNMTADYGFCTDVMEHIPTDRVDIVIKNIMDSTKKAFFQISLVDDVMGSLIGETLHLTVKPYEWWLAKFKELGFNTLWSDNQGIAACFYISTT